MKFLLEKVKKQLSNFIDDYIEELSELNNEITQRSYDFNYVFYELDNMQFSLMKHPDESLIEFNELYAQVQSYQSRLVNIIIEIRKEKQIWLGYKYTVDRFFKKLKSILFSRSDIQSLKNQELRESRIYTELDPVIAIQSTVEEVLRNLDYLIDICTLKKDDLDKANTNMSRQQKVIESLIGLGYPVNINRS